MSDHHCYACSFTSLADQTWWDEQRAERYERCLEAIERHTGPLSIMKVWHANRRTKAMFGPREHLMLQNVFRDLVAHELIKCIRRDTAGRCREYAFTSGER